MSGPSFEQGEGRWLGAAEVYDAGGRYLGPGRDARAVRRDLEGGNVEVTVSFDGPFRLSGSYVIEDHGDHRRYLGPLNHGYAEVLGDRLVDTDNYWPDIGLSQRLCLMVLPGGRAQLSLALLSRGEQAAYTVVGEYERGPPAGPGDVGAAPAGPPGATRSSPASTVSGSGVTAAPAGPPGAARSSPASTVLGSGVTAAPAGPPGAARSSPRSTVLGSGVTAAPAGPPGAAGSPSIPPVAAPGAVAAPDEPGDGGEAGRERTGALLERPGTWSGTLELLGAGGDVVGTADYSERVEAAGEAGATGDGRRLSVALASTGFTGDAAFTLHTDGRQRWTPGGSVVGSESLWGGRALAGTLLLGRDGLRLWRREVARRDGSSKGVLHMWYRGGTRVGVAHGVLEFAPAGR